jgi:hypothetical protein
MKTLNIAISELEYDKFGLKDKNFRFSDFIDIVSRELARQTLNKSIELAEKYGLSKMSMTEISKEVKAVRKSAKGRS